MKKKKIWILAAICGICGIMGGCNNPSAEKAGDTASDSTAVGKEIETYFTAIDRFFTDSIGSQYAKGDVCIPFHLVVDVEEKDSTDIKVWGDFWVNNYQQAGDTLKTVSGGSHPGLIHVRQNGNHFEVVAFDAVGDGSDYVPTARRIFGDKFDELQRVSSDQTHREAMRRDAVAAYVKRHHLPASMFQDYGWDAVSLTE